MQRKPNIILGISPGTRSMGYAIMADGELVDWGVKNFKGKWSIRKLGKIIKVIFRLVTYYNIKEIGVKTSRASHCTRRLREVYSSIEHYAKENGLGIFFYSLENLKEKCQEAKNREEMINVTITRFPELTSANSTQFNKVRFQQYEAVALVMKEF